MSTEDTLFEIQWQEEDTLPHSPPQSTIYQQEIPLPATPVESDASDSPRPNTESLLPHSDTIPRSQSDASPHFTSSVQQTVTANTIPNPSINGSNPPELAPRGYQIELYKRAYKENIIVFLDTGAGKTLVSALLIKKILEDLERPKTDTSSSTATPDLGPEHADTSPMLLTCQSPSLGQPPIGSTSPADPVTTTSNPPESTHNAPPVPPQLCLPNSLQTTEKSPAKRPTNPFDDGVFTFTKHARPAPQESKIAVFLVHRVPLVPQQAKAIRAVMKPGIQVGEYFGEKGVDSWSSSRWASSLRTKKVLVMTAQIFLNLLRHGLLDIRNVALLILDEVHHATKNHPYRKLFMEFYHTLEEDEPHPRVFGMTASPVKAKSSSQSSKLCMNAIISLEATMDATVVTVSETSKTEVEELVPRPEEFVVTYNKSHSGSDEDERIGELESSAMAEAMNVIDPYEEINQRGDDLPSKGSALPYEADDLTINDWKVLRVLHRQLGYQAASHCAREFCRLQMISSSQCLQELLSQCTSDEFQGGGITNKVKVLLDVLFSERSRCLQDQIASSEMPNANTGNRFRSIVFVQERIVARSLTWLINKIFEGLKCSELKARSAVGTQSSNASVRMSQSKLLQTIEDFRRGHFGILVATNVLEEGLDVPACRLVIAFDKVISPTSYVQARGRARKKGARYISLLAEGSVEDYNNMFMARHGAKVVRNILESGANCDGMKERMKELIRQEAAGGEKKLVSSSTKARVTATEAVNLVHRYCVMKASVIMDGKASKPHFSLSKLENSGYVCRVSFHPKFPIDGGICSVPQVSGVLAKRLAALDAYSKLYQVKEVDEFLLPKRERKSARVLTVTQRSNTRPVITQNRRKRQRTNSALQTKSSKKDRRVRQCRILHPSALQNSSQKVNVIATSSEGVAALSSASTEPDEFEKASKNVCESECGKKTAISSQQDTEKSHRLIYRVLIEGNATCLGFFAECTHLAFGLVLKNPVHDDDQTAMRCPDGKNLLRLSFEREVLWSKERQRVANKYVRSIQLCLRGKTPGSQAAIAIEKSDYGSETETNFFLVPLKHIEDGPGMNIDWDSMEELLSLGWRFGPVEQIADGWNGLQHKLVCSYHESLDRVYLSGKVNENLKASSHPQGHLNPHYTSFADYYSRKHETELKDHEQSMLEGFSVLDKLCGLSTSTFMLPPEILRVMPLSPMICYIASLLPRWQTFLALRECWRRNRISVDSPAFLSFARALQPNVNNVAKDCADFSYERLEFLGDAVLKVVYSMSAFVTNPNDDEGLLSDERDVEVSNQRLADLAVEMKIHDCVAFSGISQKAKAWPWFWGTHQNRNIHISEKVLADCVEALIGAQYLHGGLVSAAKFMDKHRVLPGACKVLGIADSTDSSGAHVPVPDLDVDDGRETSRFVHEVEDLIGYSFTDKRHLVVALTHGSFRSGHCPSYQRYEYLGDAVIGFLLLSHFFHAYPDLSPGDLTSLRGPALSNDLFARVIVSLNIHKRFWYDCAPLETEINRFAHLVANEEDEDDDVCKKMTVPKVLGDLLESILGAIVVDKGMKLEGVQEIVLRLMAVELERFANPRKFKRNPISELVHLVQKVYNLLPEYVYLDNPQDTLKNCAILVDGSEICRANGPTRRLAKHKAAIEGLKEVQKMIETEAKD